MVFVVLAIFCLLGLVFRRVVYGAELGGPAGPKLFTGVLFMFLWLIYVVMSSLKAMNLV
jgi:magnesium/proton exchanger